ncbi:MAG: hypothetical protein U0229_07325 [Anaeromyxobacter sp.]
MAVTMSELPKGKELNAMLKTQIANLQQTLSTLETEARGRLRGVLENGNTRLLELDGALAKVSKDDFTAAALKKQLDGLRHKAEGLRDDAMKKVEDVPAVAVEKFVTSTRAPIQNLAKSLADFAKKLEAAAPAKNGAKKAVKAAGEKVEKAAEKVEKAVTA